MSVVLLYRVVFALGGQLIINFEADTASQYHTVEGGFVCEVLFLTRMTLLFFYLKTTSILLSANLISKFR